MPTRDELPPRTGPWATRFDTEEALVRAEDALRAAALKEHDLAPILPFEAVYGRLTDNLGKATAIAFDPENPYGSDGWINYVYGDFLTLGPLYGVYRPAADADAGGPADEAQLWNTTVYPYPGGGAIDPTTVPLAELGLDVPGVDRRFVHFCAGLLGVEAVDDLGMLRDTFDGAWPDYRETVRASLQHCCARARSASSSGTRSPRCASPTSRSSRPTSPRSTPTSSTTSRRCRSPGSSTGLGQSVRSRAAASASTSSFLQKLKRTRLRQNSMPSFSPSGVMSVVMK